MRIRPPYFIIIGSGLLTIKTLGMTLRLILFFFQFFMLTVFYRFKKDFFESFFLFLLFRLSVEYIFFSSVFQNLLERFFVFGVEGLSCFTCWVWDSHPQIKTSPPHRLERQLIKQLLLKDRENCNVRRRLSRRRMLCQCTRE